MQQQQLSAVRRDNNDYELEDRRRKKRQLRDSEYPPQMPSPAAAHASSSSTGGTGSTMHSNSNGGTRHGNGHHQQNGHHNIQHEQRHQHQQRQQRSPSLQKVPRKLKRPHEDDRDHQSQQQSQSQQRYRSNNNRPLESHERQRQHPRDQQQHQHPRDRYRREESVSNDRKRSSGSSSSSLKHPKRPMHHDRPFDTGTETKTKPKTTMSSTTNRSNSSNPQHPQKNDPVEHLIHPKLVGRFIPRKSTSSSTTTSGSGTGTGSGSGSLILKSVSGCVPATVSQDFSTSTTKQSSTTTGSHLNDRSSNPQYHYHQGPNGAHLQAYAPPPLSEGGTTPLTEASTTSGSVSGGGAFGSVESMSTSTSMSMSTSTNRWLPSHEPPVKEIPMVVCQSQATKTKTTTAKITATVTARTKQTVTAAIDERKNNSADSNSNISNHTIKGKQNGFGSNEGIQVGTRVAVYWDGDDEFFPGTVTKERNAETYRKRFFLKYDDGDREWIDFSRHKFRVLLNDKKKHTVLDSANDNDDNDDDGESTTQSEQKGRRKLKKHVKGKSATVQQRVRVNDNDKDKEKSSTALKEERNSVVVGNEKQMARVSNDDDKYLSCSSEGKIRIKAKAEGKSTTVHRGESDLFVGKVDDNWVASGFQRSADDTSDDSETDEEEIMLWAEKMFGITPQRPIARAKAKVEPEFNWDDYADVRIPISEAVKMGRRRNRAECSTETSAPKIKRCRVADVDAATEKARIDEEEEENKRKKQEKRALTADEIRSILGEDSRACDEAAHWVRRSVRQPSKSIVNSPQVKALFEKLRMNDTDMVVLKMKKYLNDPNTPSVALDAVLDVLEENTNCEALYIQNFNEGMRDEQVLHLLKVLQRPSCKIWCINIGETYKVKSETWEIFTNGLQDTKITHMYASEHTIDSEFKDSIRSTIRSNRKKHTMHIDPDNLDTIVQCTHCWWNPINAKALRPYLKTRGCEYLLHDAEAQGLLGTMSADKVL